MQNAIIFIIAYLSEEAGVEPANVSMTSNAFEEREAHRDLSTSKRFNNIAFKFYVNFLTYKYLIFLNNGLYTYCI